MKKPEFQAVVFAAGRGARMSKLTDSIPKCLLPMANLPLIWYPLAYLANNGFREVIVIVPEKCFSDITRLLTEQCPSLNIRLDFIRISQSQQNEWGTADALRHISDKITSDLLLLSCDFISDFPLWNLLDFHRINNATLTCLLSKDVIKGPIPGPKTKLSKELQITMYEPSTNRLSLLASSVDFDNQTISGNIIGTQTQKFPVLNCTSDWSDCHLYLMKYWVMEVINEYSSISTVKSDLIPFLLKKQAAGLESLSEDLRSHLAPSPLQSMVYGMSRDPGDMFRNDSDSLKCYAYFPEKSQCSITARCDNIGVYFEANKQIVKNFEKLAPEEVILPPIPSSISSHQAQIGNDCRVGEQTTVGIKVQLKRSVVGSHCTIGERAKIVNSLVMDHVNVEEGAIITNSIICPSAHIEENAQIKDCIVGMNQSVRANEKLVMKIIDGNLSDEGMEL